MFRKRSCLGSLRTRKSETFPSPSTTTSHYPTATKLCHNSSHRHNACRRRLVSTYFICFTLSLMSVIICSLKLPTEEIIGAKTGGEVTKPRRKGTKRRSNGEKKGEDSAKVLFCQLTNEYSNCTTYETSRLACFLVRNGSPVWKTFTVSAAMVFASEVSIFPFANYMYALFQSPTIRLEISM